MPDCCHIIDDLPHKGGHGVRVVALAGNPNSGKTTIFNALTGLRQKVGNYPGVTVEKKTGRCRLADGSRVDVIDLPGTYSLISRSPDERVAMEVLRGVRKDTPAPDVVIVVVDASNLQRNLYLVSQLVELGRPMVVALNMVDIAERRGIHVSAELLSKQLGGVPVIPVVGNKKQGIPQLKAALQHAVSAPLPDWALPQAMKDEVSVVGGGLAIMDDSPAKMGSQMNARSSFHIDRYSAIAERLLIGDWANDILPLTTREPVKSLLSSATGRLAQLGIDPMQADIEAHYEWIDRVAAGSLTRAEKAEVEPSNIESQTDNPVAVLDYARTRTFTEKVDRILIHKVWGLLIFAAIMTSLFVSIFWLAKPIMDGMQAGVTWLGVHATSRLGDGPLKDLLNQGVFAGVGAVVVFVPQIALLFMFLAILEDSGYLARAAFLMDRLLAKVGLHGKSFIPLLSSFACAIPGIMATRTIESRRDRLATILIAPFMSCSARLPVYTLLIGAFFTGLGPIGQAGIMLGCYALGILAAVVTALIFRKTFLKGMPSSFILELPTYKLPQASIVARQVWSNSSQFLKKAGTTIFALSVILWALSYYPRMPEGQAKAKVVAEFARVNVERNTAMDPDSDKTGDEVELRENTIAAAQSEYSYAGRFGHAIEPVIRPLGYDWKMGVGLVSAFAAREVFVSSMGIVYAAGNTEENGTQSLAAAMRADHYTTGAHAGQAVWTPLVAVSLLVWFVLAMQCISTVAIVRRETGGWGWPIFMTVYMNGLAYVVCLVVFQIGSHLGR